ncbi:hypothetical protein OH76DRAFT_721273 [Lentinus brumalis]|uniref:Uncharacterized protein n=1 Tax=Lentinus brumalis TaxID=2498619 RepID=A0A371D520_9APHY|nr:hypothetical protein OH76DRAFT_721273 [Polyporus brumalis]
MVVRVVKEEEGNEGAVRAVDEGKRQEAPPVAVLHTAAIQDLLLLLTFLFVFRAIHVCLAIVILKRSRPCSYTLDLRSSRSQILRRLRARDTPNWDEEQMNGPRAIIKPDGPEAKSGTCKQCRVSIHRCPTRRQRISTSNNTRVCRHMQAAFAMTPSG